MHTCIHHSVIYIMSIQPVNKAVEHLISSYDKYWKRNAVNAYLMKNSKEEGKIEVILKSSRKDWVEFYWCI